MFLQRSVQFFLSLILISISSFCRENLFPGYFIKLNGDSVVCRIAYNDWRINPKTILVEVDNEKHTFNASDIKGFGAYGHNPYKSALVTYHINPISGVDLPEEFLDSVETKSYFLKTIVSGYYSLYELTLSDRSYYFLSYGDSSISELIYRAKRKENQIIEDQDYKNVLFDLYHKENISGDFSRLINNAFYSYSDLKPIVAKLNKNHIGININQNLETATKKNKPELSVFAGGLQHNFPTTIHGDFATGVKFPSSISFSGGISLSYQFANQLKSFAVGISMGYSGYKLNFSKTGTNTFYESANYNSTTHYTEEISSSNSFISAGIYLLYYFNPLSKAKVYCKASGVGNISINQNRNIVTKYSYSTESTANGIPNPPQSGQGENALVVTKKFFIQFNPGIGMAFGRHKLEFDYYLPAQLATGETKGAQFFPGSPVYEEDFKMSMLGLYYSFTIFK